MEKAAHISIKYIFCWFVNSYHPQLPPSLSILLQKFIDYHLLFRLFYPLSGHLPLRTSHIRHLNASAEFLYVQTLQSQKFSSMTFDCRFLLTGDFLWSIIVFILSWKRSLRWPYCASFLHSGVVFLPTTAVAAVHEDDDDVIFFPIEHNFFSIFFLGLILRNWPRPFLCLCVTNAI